MDGSDANTDVDTEVRTVSVHGHPVTFRQVGDSESPTAEVIVLVHGLAGSMATWQTVLNEFAQDDTDHVVIALDLVGHGGSVNPHGDYSLGGYATGIRDLLATLGHDHATIVGHSLGGGVAMQFAYQFPEWCDRLVLVSSGGLGRSVNVLLRAATLPGAELVLPVLANRTVVSVTRRLFGLASDIGFGPSADAVEFLDSIDSLADPGSRNTFTRTVRGALDLGGQRLTGTDRLYLMETMPTLIVWGTRDPMIPVGHARRAHDLIPGSELELFEGAGHFPHCQRPRRFVDVVTAFMTRTAPAHLDPAEVREMIHRTATQSPLPQAGPVPTGPRPLPEAG
jgi:pimeloyl-ACP methyl ester carboxylesterase